MSDSDYKAEASDLDSSTRQYVFEQAYDHGGLEGQSIPDFADRMVREVKTGADEYFELSDMAVRQAVLEVVADAVEAMAEDGYDEHF